MPLLRDHPRDVLQGWRNRLPEIWRRKVDGVCLDWDSLEDMTLPNEHAIWPLASNEGAPADCQIFKPLFDFPPSQVRVVIFANDPYPALCQATGRSFEQGNLTCWLDNLQTPRLVTRSLLSLVCAAVATNTEMDACQLSCPNLRERRQKLRCVLQNASVTLPPPSEIFGCWARQGVLWLNRTPTFCCNTHQKHHRKLWKPFTRRIIRVIVAEARCRLIDFVLWGEKAKGLRRSIRSEINCSGIPSRNVCIATSGHPSSPRHFFRNGSPLSDIRQQVNWAC